MFKLFIDLDGVLVNFDAGVRVVTGKDPADLKPWAMWPALAKYEDFYATLEWMPDGRELWAYVKDKSPTILTGLPLGKWAGPQKRTWCARELGEDVPVITCLSREKALWAEKETPSGKTPVLVDDRVSLRNAWVQRGGIFVHHTSALRSMDELKNIGI